MLRWIEGWESATTSNTTHGRIYESLAGAVGAAVDGASEAAGEAITSSSLVLVTKPIATAVQNSWIIGLAFRPNNTVTINSPNIPYVSLRNDAGEQIRFEFLEDDSPISKPGGTAYKIRVMRGATELASSVERFVVSASEQEWVYFEFKVTINDATGSFEGRYQFPRKPSRNVGSPFALTWDAANTNVDTQEQGTTGANRFSLSMDTGNATRTVATDDIYVCDSTGTKNNDYLGRLLIDAQKPAGDGTTVSWDLASATSTQDAWDEPLNTEDDDGRVTTEVTSAVHLATVDPLGAFGGSSTIVGVRHDIIAHMETSGDLDIAHMFRKTTGTPAETNAGAALNVDSTTYEGHAVVLEDDPNTSTDWDIADLDSYQYGVRNDG